MANNSAGSIGIDFGGVNMNNAPSVNQSNVWGNIGSALGISNSHSDQAIAQQERKNQQWFNDQEAQKQRDWEATMSNSAVQRRKADLIAAGMNPILAAGSSASTPSGASANSAQARYESANSELKGATEAIYDFAKTFSGARTRQESFDNMVKLMKATK